MSKLNDLAKIIEAGDLENAVEATQAALDEGNAPLDVLNIGLVAPINVLGEKFRIGEIFVPELLIAAQAMKMGVEVVKPYLVSGDNEPLGKIVFATVAGDMHDIGKNLCVLLLEAAGFEVNDLGMDVDPEDIIEAVEDDEEVFFVGMSAMLTTTMYAMQEVVEGLKEKGIRDQVKVGVGGAPVNQIFCDQIGADIYTTNAPSLVETVKGLL